MHAQKGKKAAGRNGQEAATRRGRRRRGLTAYEQYWLAAPELPQREWDLAAGDFARIAAALHAAGLCLAGPDGDGGAVINGDVIAFNGVRRCGHAPQRRGGVAWPDPGATGIARQAQGSARPAAAAAAEEGLGEYSPRMPPLIAPASARACDGSCAAGPFVLRRTMPDNEYTKVYGTESPLTINGVRDAIPREWVGKYFNKCRTLYKPYDLAVCCCLLVAKRWFGALMVVASDGTNDNWADVRGACQRVLGYGAGMTFGAGGQMRRAAGARTPAAPDMSGRHVPVYSPDGDGMDFEEVGRSGDGVVFVASDGGDREGSRGEEDRQ